MKVAFDGQQAAAAYSQAFRHLRTLPNFAPQRTLLGEAAVILKTWAGRTSVSTLARADLRTWVHTVRSLDLTGGKRNADATITVSAGLRGPRGRVWMRKRDGSGWRRTHNAGFSPINQHYKRGDWIDLQEAIATVQSAVRRNIPKGRGAVGIARQSVIQIADDLGIALENIPGGGTLSAAGIAKARAAIATTGRMYRNGYGQQGGNEVRHYVDLFTRLPYGTTIGMDRTLAGVLAGRAKYIEKSYETGAFNSVRAAARSFPALFNASSFS